MKELLTAIGIIFSLVLTNPDNIIKAKTFKYEVKVYFINDSVKNIIIDSEIKPKLKDDELIIGDYILTNVSNFEILSKELINN